MIRNFIVQKFLHTLEEIHFGTLTLTTPDDKHYTFEGSSNKNIAAHLHILSWKTLDRIRKNGGVGLAEAYRDRLFECDNLTNLIVMIYENESISRRYENGNILTRLAVKLYPLLKPNNHKNSIDNIHAHYDIGNEFYQLWLDKDMHYSSALFKKNHNNSTSLEDAQTNKCMNVIDSLQPSGNLLEIGCGWGGFADLSVAKNDYAYKGITISEQQFDYAKKRLKKHDNASVVFEDYRDQKGTYENIVSIEMFEAVGERYWSAYFRKIKELLHREGKAIVQTITIADYCFDEYRKTNDPIRQFIFPGGLLPSYARFKQDSERAGLKIVDCIAFGDDYKRTLSTWLKNFENCLPALHKLGFDDAFIRIWRFYLASCEGGFIASRCNVRQIHLKHS